MQRGTEGLGRLYDSLDLEIAIDLFSIEDSSNSFLSLGLFS